MIAYARSRMRIAKFSLVCISSEGISFLTGIQLKYTIKVLQIHLSEFIE